MICHIQIRLLVARQFISMLLLARQQLVGELLMSEQFEPSIPRF